ncbi:MAG: hypothetical protein HY796_12595 [Elusimicrobia bacterium]|nr:hypothetical protein [Elusimicrobiota bacterium]
MEKAFKVIYQMHKKGILEDYAIGGAVATIYYTEPFDTQDIDIFFVPPEKEKIIILTPFYDWLVGKKKYKVWKEYILIRKTPIQFIPAATELEKEAVKRAVIVSYKGIELKILRAEYLIAIFLQIYRRKDIAKLIKLFDEAKIDKGLLREVLARYGLGKKLKDFMDKYYDQCSC